MALPQGIPFRATAGYVTDGADDDVEFSASPPNLSVNYPRTTAQGNNVGWETIPSGNLESRDRNDTIDSRLAGMHFSFGGSTAIYRIDLPSSGSKNVRLASGDANYSAACDVELFDTASSLGQLSATNTTGGGRFRDATDAEHTSANWPANNTAVNVSFSTTICRVHVAVSTIAYFYIEDAGGGGGGDTNARLMGGDLLQSLLFGRLVN